MGGIWEYHHFFPRLFFSSTVKKEPVGGQRRCTVLCRTPLLASRAGEASRGVEPGGGPRFAPRPVPRGAVPPGERAGGSGAGGRPGAAAGGVPGPR